MNIDAIMAFEDGALAPDEVIDLFSELVATGAAWTLQGFYGRTAVSLIDSGYIDHDGTILRRPSDGAL